MAGRTAALLLPSAEQINSPVQELLFSYQGISCWRIYNLRTAVNCTLNQDSGLPFFKTNMNAVSPLNEPVFQ
jgi:hypothetical protein